jgi:hypothetical protein
MPKNHLKLLSLQEPGVYLRQDWQVITKPNQHPPHLLPSDLEKQGKKMIEAASLLISWVLRSSWGFPTHFMGVEVKLGVSYSFHGC